MTINKEHTPVLLEEAISSLQIKSGGTYIDCNLGMGGHTRKILGQGGIVYGIDIDENAIEICKSRFPNEILSKKLLLINKNFANIDKIGLSENSVDGILYDLGTSMHQLWDEEKGFSFKDETVMDMRMDKDLGVTANDLVKMLSEDQLSKLIFEYGEDPQAKRFAKAIKNLYARSKTDPKAFEVAEAIKMASAYKTSRIHPATRTFQALRIAVNSELDNLRESLNKATLLLKPKGRLAIISFHSLEDKIAKNLAESPSLIQITRKPIVPSLKEVDENPSSRSAKLRIYEKI